ncbi:MAG: M28 family peptidase [Candidatus Ventricola sp.]
MEDKALMEQLRAALLGPHEVRRTKKQKTAFLSWVSAYARSLGVSVAVEESGKAIRSRNVVFGDVDKARTIITAHYDTCAWMPLGAGITPGCWPILLLIELVQLVFLLPLLLLMFFGVSNPHTANDNTSGVLLVLLLMAQMKDRPDVAFVLFDNEETGLWGSQAFIRAHPQAARRFLLNLDCVGDGDTLLFTGVPRGLRMPQAVRLQKAMEAIAPRYGMSTTGGAFPKWLYPSDQMLFPRGTAFAALKGKKLLYLDRIHTARDTVLDHRNLLCLAEIIGQSV